jgi:hypothetical protein
MGPIEPAAITAATLLASKALEALGGKAGESTWAGLGRLVTLVRRKVTGHRQAEVALAEIEQHPDDQAGICRLAEILAALGAQDAGFHRELAALVADARRDPVVGLLATQVYGQAQVGQLVNVGQARDIYIQPPLPPTAPTSAPARADQVQWPTGGRTVSNLPPRNLVFTGRDDQLSLLRHRLSAASAAIIQPLALHGLGGVGKTQVALEYAHRHISDYDLIWWLAAEQPATIPGQMVVLARRLGITEQTDQAETVQALWDELRHRDRWLLIFDNAEQPLDLRPWWPPDSGRMLVTSRNPAWGGAGMPLPVDVLPRDQAIAFLARRLGSADPQALDQLADALGDLPLALEQAAAYLDETGAPVTEYLELLGDRAPELFTLGRPATTEQTIATTWSVALGHLREQARGAAQPVVVPGGRRHPARPAHPAFQHLVRAAGCHRGRSLGLPADDRRAPGLGFGRHQRRRAGLECAPPGSSGRPPPLGHRRPAALGWGRGPPGAGRLP